MSRFLCTEVHGKNKFFHISLSTHKIEARNKFRPEKDFDIPDIFDNPGRENPSHT